MIVVRIQERLDELNEGVPESEQKTFSWLARAARVSHQTLWRMKYNLSKSIDKAILERICEALECEPGDLIVRKSAPKPGDAQQKRTRPKGKRSKFADR